MAAETMSFNSQALNKELMKQYALLPRELMAEPEKRQAKMVISP